jgi:hypothetical protein
MATFRTDPDTGRTVISSENQVGSDGMTDLERASVAAGGSSGVFDDPRFSEASRGTFDPGSIASVPLTFDQFMTSTGRSATNPYGDQGFFSRVFGIDPSKISYANNIPGGGVGIAQLNALAYDRYMNPAARTNIFGDRVGGDPTTGQLRYGVQPGDLTRFGRAVPARREGVAGILDSLPFGIGLASRMFGSTPARVPGFDVREVVPQLGLGGPQPGEGVDPAQRMPSEMLSLGYDPDTRIPGGGGELDVGPFASDFFYNYASPEEIRTDDLITEAEQMSSSISPLPDYEEMVGATPDDLIYDMPYPAPPPRQLRNIDEPLTLPGLF